MFGKKVIRVLFIVVVVSAITGFAGKAYAIGVGGTACFRDSLGGIWSLDYLEYAAGSGKISLMGNRLADVEICNNSKVQPAVGSASILSNGVLLMGLQTITNDPGKCSDVSWSVPLSTSSFAGTGGKRTQTGAEGNVTMWVVDCASGLPTTPPAAQVSILDSSFSPQTITVNVGDTVQWTNNGVLGHSATSGANWPTKDGIWDSEILSGGQSFSFTFTQSGTFPYFCTPHGFTGTVIVR